MPTDRNYWATYKDHLVRWMSELPPPAQLGIERVFDFARQILAAAEREQVMRVVEVHHPWPFKPDNGWTWLDHIRRLFEREGVVELFPKGGPAPMPEGRLRLPARLAYYRGNRIVEEDVEDLGLLLRNLHSPVPEEEGLRGRYSTTPIRLSGYSRSFEGSAPGKAPAEDGLHISLALQTDIWFPRVIGANVGDGLGRLDEGHPARGRDLLMDNSALASRHTPRLNRFIQTLRDAILALGGTWYFESKETHFRYLPMIYDGGINLDYPAANA